MDLARVREAQLARAEAVDPESAVTLALIAQHLAVLEPSINALRKELLDLVPELRGDALAVPVR